MPYVRRDADGVIASLHRRPEGDAVEFVDDADPAVQAFVGAGRDDGFSRLDAEFIRVLEDVIDVLVRRNLIAVTDLPADARRKLYSRKGQRVPTRLSELGLLGAGDGVGDLDVSIGREP